jgi:hypothetical protein
VIGKKLVKAMMSKDYLRRSPSMSGHLTTVHVFDLNEVSAFKRETRSG